MGQQTSQSTFGKTQKSKGQAQKSMQPRGRDRMHSQGDTGVKDANYNLISILYHALQGAETYAEYIADAEAAGDQELAAFFTEVRDEERDKADRAMMLLAGRIGGEQSGDADESEEE
jgi:hypothetical protein